VRTVASEEYLPIAQTAKQRESEQRLYVIADEIVPKLEMSRRRFIQASSGMAAGFLRRSAKRSTRCSWSPLLKPLMPAPTSHLIQMRARRDSNSRPPGSKPQESA